MSFHMLKAYLYKISIDKRLCKGSELEANPSPDTLRRSYMLVSYLNAIKAAIKSFLLLPTSTILSMPYFYWIQMLHCLAMFSRLLIERPTLWDPNLLTGIHEFVKTLERTSNKIEDATRFGASMSPPRYLPSIFSIVRQKMNNLSANIRESSRVMSSQSHEARPRVILAAKAFDARNMMMDSKTVGLLIRFLQDGNLIWEIQCIGP